MVSQGPKGEKARNDVECIMYETQCFKAKQY